MKLCISEHEPRKGTETILYVCMFHLHEKSFRNTNPARGRKRDRRGSGNDRQGRLEFQNTNPARGRKLGAVVVVTTRHFSFQNTNPERGRKQSIGFSYFHILFNGNFKTRTPKGDGNSEPSSCTSPKTFQNTNPERGRKHKEMCYTKHISSNIISEHEPRKGTEIGYDFLLMKSQPVVYVLSLQCILLILN